MRCLLPENPSILETRMLNAGSLRAWLYAGLVSIPATSSAEIFSITESMPTNELWLNPGFYSHHYQKNKGLNDRNRGLGAEYRYSTVSSFTLGEFDNSNGQAAHYLGWYWQPLRLGPVRLGAAIGALDGYPRMQGGGWFMAAIPAASLEYENVGVNMIFIPNIQDKVYGAISLQLKLKAF